MSGDMSNAHTEMSAVRSKGVPPAQRGTGAWIPQALPLRLQTRLGYRL